MSKRVCKSADHMPEKIHGYTQSETSCPWQVKIINRQETISLALHKG